MSTKSWIDLALSKGKSGIKMIIVANKSDLGTEENALVLEGRELAERHRISFALISALDADQVQNTFQSFVALFREGNSSAVETSTDRRSIQRQSEVIRMQ